MYEKATISARVCIVSHTQEVTLRDAIPVVIACAMVHPAWSTGLDELEEPVRQSQQLLHSRQ